MTFYLHNTCTKISHRVQIELEKTYVSEFRARSNFSIDNDHSIKLLHCLYYIHSILYLLPTLARPTALHSRIQIRVHNVFYIGTS